MGFLKLSFMGLLCGFVVAQDNPDRKAVSDERQSCFSNTCKFLEEFIAMKVKQEALETRLKETESQLVQMKSKEETQVVFSAATDDSAAIGPFTADTTVVYRRVITNVGNAYNQFTGVFVAPVTGIYYFTFFYHAGGEHAARLGLMKNNESVVTAFDHHTLNDGADNGANAVFLNLQQEDHVYMRLYKNTHIWGDPMFTTFSGFLLRQISAELSVNV